MAVSYKLTVTDADGTEHDYFPAPDNSDAGAPTTDGGTHVIATTYDEDSVLYGEMQTKIGGHTTQLLQTAAGSVYVWGQATRMSAIEFKLYDTDMKEIEHFSVTSPTVGIAKEGDTDSKGLDWELNDHRWIEIYQSR